MMLLDMQGHDAIEQLGQWIAERASGQLRLSAAGAEFTLGIADGKVVSIRGLDSAEVARRLEVEATGREDLLREAVTLAADNDLPQGQAVSAAKEVLQSAVAAWLADNNRRVELDESHPPTEDGPTISLTHAIVEVVLSDQSGKLRRKILPDGEVLLRRSKRFLELYSPLRLSEEADLIVAKVTGQRTVQEISHRSPHGADEVDSLLAALVCTGILEKAPLSDLELDRPQLSAHEPGPAAHRRRVPIWLLLAALGVLLIGTVLVAKVWRGSAGPGAGSSTEPSHWAVVVDMGCEPQDLQRVLKKSGEHSKVLRAIAADAGEGSPCWRLVWGRFADSDAANRAIPNIPTNLLTEGFTPHAIELSADGSSAKTSGGEE